MEISQSQASFEVPKIRIIEVWGQAPTIWRFPKVRLPVWAGLGVRRTGIIEFGGQSPAWRFPKVRGTCFGVLRIGITGVNIGVLLFMGATVQPNPPPPTISCQETLGRPWLLLVKRGAETTVASCSSGNPMCPHPDPFQTKYLLVVSRG